MNKTSKRVMALLFALLMIPLYLIPAEAVLRYDKLTGKYYDGVYDGRYILHCSLDWNRVLDLWDNNSDVGTVHMWELNDTAAQDFSVKYVSRGWYKILHTASGKAVTNQNGVAVLKDYTGKNNQLWKFINVTDDGYFLGYRIQNKSGGYLTSDPNGLVETNVSAIANGTKALVIDWRSTKRQMWKLESSLKGWFEYVSDIYTLDSTGGAVGYVDFRFFKGNGVDRMIVDYDTSMLKVSSQNVDWTEAGYYSSGTLKIECLKAGSSTVTLRLVNDDNYSLGNNGNGKSSTHAINVDVS